MLYRLLFILLLLPTPPGKKVISGQLMTDKPKDYPVAYYQIILKNKGEIIDRVHIDQQGMFSYTFADHAPKQVDINYTTLGMGADMYLQHIELTDITDTIQLNLSIPATVRKNLMGKAICPKCNKTDETREVVYGNPIATRIINEAGDTTYSPVVGKKYYMGSCIGSEQGPHWHCNRDDIFF